MVVVADADADTGAGADAVEADTEKGVFAVEFVRSTLRRRCRWFVIPCIMYLVLYCIIYVTAEFIGCPGIMNNNDVDICMYVQGTMNE